jgi:hypothetical protein
MFFLGKNFQALLNLYRKTNCSHIDLLVLRNVIQYQAHVNIFGDTPLITHTLILTAVDTSQTSINAATNKEKSEVYAEDSGWGPSRGRNFVFQIPAGVGFIEVREGQSQTGIELSDLRFVWVCGERGHNFVSSIDNFTKRSTIPL